MYDVEMTDPRVSHAVHAENGASRDQEDRIMAVAARADRAARVLLTQAEVIQLSGRMINATADCSRIAAGLSGRRSEQPLYAVIADELRAIRDALTLCPVSGPVPIPF
jgi:hypothetical protein